MNPSLSDEQKMLDATIQRLCEDIFSLQALRDVEKSDGGFSQALWEAFGKHGICGVQVVEAYEGLGLGAVEAAIIYERLGRSLVHTPHFVSCILAARLIAVGGSAMQKQRWLPRIATGEIHLTVASLEPEGDARASGINLLAVDDGDTLILQGCKHFVPFAETADAMIVLARRAGLPSGNVIAVIVDSKSSGLRIRRQHNLATEPYSSVLFQNVRVPLENILNSGRDSWNIWREAMFNGIIPLAAMATGAAGAALEMSVKYANERQAFGRAIGGFQALAHDLADAAVAIQGCRAMVRRAAATCDGGRPFRRLAAMAKLQACSTFRSVSALSIQVHGGIGYTLSADPQLYFRRAKQWQLLNWSDADLENEIYELTFTEASSEHAMADDV